MQQDWVVWQLCDSAFPTGAFAHSGGLEAAWQAGDVADGQGLSEWVAAAMGQAGHSTLPFVRAGWEGTPSMAELDAVCESLLLNHVANRASRAQGQALLVAAVRTFHDDSIRRVEDVVRRGRLHGHYAPILGAVCGALGVPLRRTCDLFMFLTLRGAISTAVRLGIVGPLQGQGLQHEFGQWSEAVVERCMTIPLEDVAQTSPLVDVFQGAQDRLYSRLFVS